MTYENTVHNTAKIFADDTKLYSEINDVLDCERLQQLLLKFNSTKCVVLHLRQYVEYIYSLHGHDLESVHQQRDLGVIISSDLKPDAHISNIVKKASQKVGLVKRCFSNLTSKKVTILYTSCIRPLLQ